MAMLTSRAIMIDQVLFFQIAYADRNASNPRTRVMAPRAVLIIPGLKPIRAKPPKITIPPAINCNSVSPSGRDRTIFEGSVSVIIDLWGWRGSFSSSSKIAVDDQGDKEAY